MTTEQELDEAECTRRGVQIASLKAEIYQLKGRVSRQRRELRRLNKTISALWAGARFQVNVMAAQRERSGT
jgi:hypothetical protein